MNFRPKVTVKQIALHLLFWILLSCIYYKNLQVLGGAKYYWLYTYWLLPIEMAATYFMAYFLVPKYLLQKKYLLFISLLLLSGIGFILLERYIWYEVLYPLTFPQGREMPFFFLPALWDLGLTTYSIAFLFSGTRVYQTLVKDQNQRLKLEKQTLHSELALLRSQINPHFLFNTLNNIDLLVFKDQQKASDSIVKLSEIMRYMLYESNTAQVPLDREIQYLVSMIDLMRLRLKGANFIAFSVDGDSKNKYLPPMLLVPFVENAYKHGKKIGPSPGIEIKLEISSENYLFSVINQVDKGKIQSKDKVGGIGLNNVMRRLDLIYGNDYVLNILNTDNLFKVILKLPQISTTNNITQK